LIEDNNSKETDLSYFQNTLAYGAWMNNPEAKLKFKNIIKDFPLANFDQKDIEFVEAGYDLSKQLEEFVIELVIERKIKINGINKVQRIVKKVSIFKPSANFFLELAYLRSNTSLGRNATARRLERTTFSEQKGMQEIKEPKRSWIHKKQ